MRFVHQQPQYDELRQTSNFFLDQWSPGDAPALYVAGCANGAVTCSGTTRQARNPRHGAVPRAELDGGDRHAGAEHRQPAERPVPVRAGDRRDHLHVAGAGDGAALRRGLRRDGQAEARAARRHGALLRPAERQLDLRAGAEPAVDAKRDRAQRQLQALGSAQFATEGAPSLSVFEYESNLPSSAQWNVGVQMMLPWATSLDVEYVGQHSYNIIENVNLNCDRFRRSVPAAEPGPDAWRERRPGRFRGAPPSRCARSGLRQHQHADEPRLDHVPLPAAVVQAPVPERPVVRLQRHDQAVEHGQRRRAVAAQRGRHVQLPRRPGSRRRIFSAADPVRHTMQGNFVWDLPDLKSTSGFGAAGCRPAS